jgi:putative DNA primase/helicase
MMRAAEIASSIGSAWPAVLEQLGIAPEYLRNKHGPCPVCGGKDRYRFHNRRGHGDFYCNGCKPGDGFTLLMRVHGWDFRTARDRVMQAAGLREASTLAPPPRRSTWSEVADTARPPSRVLRLKRESCAVFDCAQAIDYLMSRHLWPLPDHCSLRAHVAADYFDGGERIGRYAALIAEVRDIEGELVTIHTTYLDAGRKLATHEPRKLLSPLTGREGCAVRLTPIAGDTLGIGEGIETCLAAARRHDLPVWAALNTSLLAKFTPPATVKRLVILADNDVPGLQAAAALMQRLQGRVALEIRTPKAPAKDFADEYTNGEQST